MLRILCGDARVQLEGLPGESVQCCVTSPPYWALRDYGHPDQLGLEKTPEEYISKLTAIFEEVRRVLRKDGTLWLNLGDTYAAQRGGSAMPAETLAGGISGQGDKDAKRGRESAYVPSRNAASFGLKHKDLVGIPWMAAFALRGAGWYLRQDIIWHKPSVMPESVTDRCTKAHEHIFLLAKSEKYFYDHEAIKEPSEYPEDDRKNHVYDHHKSKPTEKVNGLRANYLDGGRKSYPLRNKRSVWTVSTANYSEAHFATFPPDLIKPCILAGSKPGDVILDPFGGSGTTGAVALEYGRNAILIELNPDYVKLAQTRCDAVTPGFLI